MIKRKLLWSLLAFAVLGAVVVWSGEQRMLSFASENQTNPEEGENGTDGGEESGGKEEDKQEDFRTGFGSGSGVQRRKVFQGWFE